MQGRGRGSAAVRSWIAAWKGDIDADGAQDVIPSQVARRRARWGLGIALGACVGFDAVIGLLVRAHQIGAGCTGYAMGVGGVSWFLVFPILFGTSSHVRLVVGGGRRFVVARTLTGPRAVDLDALVRVRRFQMLSKSGRNWDELRLRDRHGVRLSVDRVGNDVERAIRSAVEVPGARASAAVRERLGLSYSGLGGTGQALLGTFAFPALSAGCCVASLFLTCLISGTPFNG
jgi:hypothetical protein